MEYKGNSWHETCFLCQRCQQPMGTKSFIPKDNNYFCVPCFEKQFAYQCCACKKVSHILYVIESDIWKTLLLLFNLQFTRKWLTHLLLQIRMFFFLKWITKRESLWRSFLNLESFSLHSMHNCMETNKQYIEVWNDIRMSKQWQNFSANSCQLTTILCFGELVANLYEFIHSVICRLIDDLQLGFGKQIAS